MGIGSCYNCANCDFLTEPTSCTKGGDIPVHYNEIHDVYLLSTLDFDCQYFENKRPEVKRKRKRNLYREGYNQAIDDFVEKLSGVRCECCGKFREHCSQGNYCFIDEIGEQLKKVE